MRFSLPSDIRTIVDPDRHHALWNCGPRSRSGFSALKPWMIEPFQSVIW